jgi:hypothetical protein
MPGGDAQIKLIQELANNNLKKYTVETQKEAGEIQT